MPAERDPALPPMAVGGSGRGRGPGWAWPAAALAVFGVAGLLALLLSDGNGTEGGAVVLSSVLALTAVPAVAGLAAVAAHQWTARRYAAALREARLTLQLQPQLLDQWQWRTDVAHRLQAWTPAVGAPAVHWSAIGRTGQPLWDGFETEDGQDALRQRLQAQQPLLDVEVRQRGGPGAVSTWRLRGVPRYDAEGRFAGYLGTARPIDVERAQQGDHAALLLLLKAWPGPVWLLEQPHAGARWTLVHSNDAAAQLLPRRPTPETTDLEALTAALPDGLGPALAPLVASGGSATVGDWEARLEHSADRGDGAPALLLLGLLPRATAAAGAEPAEQASFIYTISHDLRAPIRVVEGFTRILKEDYGRLLDRIGNDHFDRVLGAAARA
ncbi:PAS domain-containing protein [Aquabacterium sp. J223]|uniref:PAS domain-containing protein n=1 Tax=Aquabacterium sp. J223 TaxID=2898431 RepID=UPI0021AD5F11|nr:PAS domain-containing protein [Aquabacterium sp. J223]UUX97568.1 hypothetical protein LRS07_10195 [Aquabacterium sp. J223]